MPQFSRSDVRTVLTNSSDHNISNLAYDTALVASLAAVLNATLEIAEEFPRTKGEVTLAIAKKGLSVSGVAATATGSQGLELANFAAGQTLKSIGLFKIAGLSPAKAGVYITITMAEKVVSAASLAERDKCKTAIATLALSTATTGVGCWLTGGIGCVAGAISIAADAFNVYGQCRSK